MTKMKANYAARIAAVLIVAVFSGTIYAAYNVIDTPAVITMDGPTLFTASGPDVTNVWTGKITGTGPAIIEGGGTVAFANSANDYTGGTLVSNAVFRLDADGCAGTGAITGAVNTAHVFADCANVPNDIFFMTGASVTDYMAPGAYPAAGQNLIFPLCSDVTFKGIVSFKGQAHIFSGTSPISVSSVTMTFEKGLTNSSTLWMYPVSGSKFIFKDRYVSAERSRARMGGKSTGQGSFEFHASSNVLYRLDSYNADFNFKAKDVFPDTVFCYENGNVDMCKTYLNGFDQTVAGFAWQNPAPVESSTGLCFTSEDDPATVRIVGCELKRVSTTSISPSTKVGFYGKITLVMDVASSYTAGGFYQEFAMRKNTMSGDLIISNGDFRVSGTASFPNVPNIYVGTGGSFTNASTKSSAFAGCLNLTVLGKMANIGDASPFGFRKAALTLGADAEFTLPAGAVMAVNALKVGENNMPNGRYGDGGTPVSQIKQGTVVVIDHDRYVDCVNGSDLNDGTEGHPFQTIRAATTNAIPGDVIHVAPGTYGALEGTQTATTKTGKSRVVVPADVTLESTDGAENTFIVGAEATGDQIDNATYKTGTNGVRCVYAKSGSVVRGFTLTGGRGIGIAEADGKGVGSAFYAATERAAALEDCVISNNAAYRSTIYRAVVRRCRVFENIGTRTDNISGPAGSSCSWFNCIIDKNVGGGTVHYPVQLESCTIGDGNGNLGGSGSPQVIYYNTSEDRAIVNSAILGGRSYYGGGGKLYCTNCLILSSMVGSNIKREHSYNTIFTNAAAMRVDSEYRPVLGKFMGIDKGDATYSSDALGDKDVYGTPRVLNGKIDIGAVEYDWRPTFSAELGRRFTVTYASPSVTTNLTGGLLVHSGAVAGTVTSADPYAITFEMSGGTMAVYVGGELAGESSGTGEQSIRFTVANAADEVRFVYTPEAGSVAVLKKVSGARGSSISIR